MSLCLSETLRLRIASGGYDCRKGVCLASRCLPSTYNHSCRKIECLYGRHFMMQPLRGRHTLTRHHACLHRLHYVTCLHYGRRLDGIIILTTASSDLQALPGTKTAHVLRSTPYVSSSLAASIIPPLFNLQANSYDPAPNPCVGRTWGAGSHGRQGSMPTRATDSHSYLKESVPCSLARLHLTSNHSLAKDCLSDVSLCQ